MDLHVLISKKKKKEKWTVRISLEHFKIVRSKRSLKHYIVYIFFRRSIFFT